MSALFQAQQATYHAASEYHRALVQYFAAQHPDNKGQGLHEAVEQARHAAEIYKTALTALLDCMLTSAWTEVEEEDIHRVRRHLELLEIETARIRG